jgi:hypothetical protein
MFRNTFARLVHWQGRLKFPPHEVSNHVRRIKHGQTEKLPELFLTFNSHEEATSFHCTYEINDVLQIATTPPRETVMWVLTKQFSR